MHHSQTQYPRRMRANRAKVDGDQKQPCSGQRGAQAEDAEIPHLHRIHMNDAGGMLRQKQRQKHTQRRDGAIGGDEDTPDVKENWMHLIQDKAASSEGTADPANLMRGKEGK